MPDRYTPELIGRTATTRWGEHGTITGSAQDPARCRFQPDTPGSGWFTPQLQHLTFDPVESKLPAHGPCLPTSSILRRWHEIGGPIRGQAMYHGPWLTDSGLRTLGPDTSRRAPNPADLSR